MPSSSSTPLPASRSRPFGRLPTGEQVTLHTLTNAHGLQTEIADYGGIVTRLLVPDRRGVLADVVLGFRTLEEYVADSPYFGALIGRVGNRIMGGRFTLDGKTYHIFNNNTPGGIPSALHGGKRGFDKVIWQAEPVRRDGATGLQLRYRSPDGEEGFPGNLDVTVWYWLTDRDELTIEYRATTDQATPVNLTQHNYFNLAGEGSGEILGHVLTLHASRFTPVDAGLIPTGELAPVAGTPFDFTRPTPIGDRIQENHPCLKYARGYDVNWVIDRTGPGLVHAATAFDPTSGRQMEVWTEEPGVQCYAGNFLHAGQIGKTGRPYAPYHGFCLETQHYPDSPNQPAFPSIILRPGAILHTTTVHRFSAR